MALLNGGTLFLRSAEQLMPGRELAEFIRDQRLTHFTMPPSVTRGDALGRAAAPA
ncbi:hypothetical protein GCM10017687_36740 [Streptomyces echinatus]|uniref:hypothetical protein n=1 Tax=Streptomyces echinatus TaxID=67293 RepID=UPI0031EE56A6